MVEPAGLVANVNLTARDSIMRRMKGHGSIVVALLSFLVLLKHSLSIYIHIHCVCLFLSLYNIYMCIIEFGKRKLRKYNMIILMNFLSECRLCC